jgi:hypothetical protein
VEGPKLGLALALRLDSVLSANSEYGLFCPAATVSGAV